MNVQKPEDFYRTGATIMVCMCNCVDSLKPITCIIPGVKFNVTTYFSDGDDAVSV